MALAQIKKAVVAGVGAGLAAATGALVEAWPGGIDNGEWGTILGGFVSAAFVVGLATWKARNAPPDPEPEPGPF